MPRSIKRPQTGSIVWYYAAAPPTTVPQAAMVIKTVNKTTFDLALFAATGDGLTAALATPFYEGGTRPASGAWCTNVRVNENAANQWPTDR